MLLIDKSVDISTLYSASEEEDKQNGEKDINKRLVNSLYENSEFKVVSVLEKQHTQYCIKNYASPFVNTISPPPKRIVLL